MTPISPIKPARGPVAPAFSGEGELRRGITVLICVNILWALLPIYWKQLTHVPPLEVLSHRSVWGFILVMGLLWLRGGMSELLDIVRNKRTLMFMTGCSFSHMFAWGFYIWAVGTGHILDAALGNYILPMFSVLCGYLVFRERPRRLQWAAIFMAGTGVLGMILWYGELPWIGLIMALNSVLYASLRKQAPINATPGIIIELVISSPFLWGYLAYLLYTGQAVFSAVSLEQDLWLVGAGLVTIIPQLGYAYGLCRVPLTTISLLQYIPPTGNFLVGLLLFKEPFTPDKIFGFIFIWLGLIIFSVESVHHHRTKIHPVLKKTEQ